MSTVVDGRDEVVLVDGAGDSIGRMSRSATHGFQTPRHLGFSLYLFDDSGHVLVTRRALSKRTWPGVWTNSCCGHPRPGEPWPDAVTRRLAEELGLTVTDLVCALPDFSYRARDAGGLVEDEACPTFVGRAAGDVRSAPEPRPDPAEVAEWTWTPFAELVAAARAAPYAFSPWSVGQLARLDGCPAVPAARAAAVAG